MAGRGCGFMTHFRLACFRMPVFDLRRAKACEAQAHRRVRPAADRGRRHSGDPGFPAARRSHAPMCSTSAVPRPCPARGRSGAPNHEPDRCRAPDSGPCRGLPSSRSGTGRRRRPPASGESEESGSVAGSIGHAGDKGAVAPGCTPAGRDTLEPFEGSARPGPPIARTGSVSTASRPAKVPHLGA